MGLISGLLTLPLAPVRGMSRLASWLESQAEKEAYDDANLHAALLELQAARERGEFSEEEIEQAENVMLERVFASRGFGEQETAYGEVE
jgi:hypothetical protein